MKKRKTYEISVIDKTYSKIISDETKFYTSDTALELGFELKETDYNFESAEIVLLNIDDRSLVTRPVAKNLDGFSYELGDDIIAHYGEWRGQIRFEKAGEIYVSSPVKFRIENDLSNDRPPQLSDVQSWVSLKRYADSLTEELKQAVLSIEGIEDTFNANELERQTTFEDAESERDRTFESNETTRQSQELEREKAESQRQTVFDGNEANRTETFNNNEATRQENEDVRIEAEKQRNETVKNIEARQNSVETQFNSIQQEMTDKDVISAPEIIAARNGKSNLKERLDAEYQEVSTQLAQTNRPLKYGQLKMPSDFKPNLPAFFYRDNDGIIKHNMDFQNRYKNGKKIYVRNNGNDTSGDGSVGSPFKTIAKAISVAIAGSELKYEIITNQPTINDTEFIFNQTVTNKTIAFISEGSFDESTKKENVYTASPVSGWTEEGGFLKTTTENSKITQTVRGSNIYLNARFDTLGGIMQVRLDGDNSTIKTITTYSTVASSREELIYWNLEDDNHTVEITYLGPDQTVTYGGSPRLWLIIANPTFRTTYNDISSGYKWSKNKTLVSSNRDYVWTSDGVGTYKTSRTGLRNVIDKENIDIYGMPIPLKNAGSLADCKSTPNTWFSDGTNVWVHRKDGKTPTMENTVVNIGVAGINPKLGDGGVIYFENFIFTPYVTAHPISVTNDSTNPQGEICLNKVGLVGGVNTNSRGNGLAIEGVKNTFSFDTIAAYAQLDGFNYHYTNILESQKRDCLALEYNCKAYDLGLVFSGAGSNNATSMHEGASILRIGTIGYRNTGATIIDVNGCYSVLYDCNAHTPMSDGIEGNGRAFSFTTEKTGREGKAYLINCGAMDAEFSLVADANQKIYLNNFKHDGIIQSSGEIEYI